jgi:hypothetical protein
MRVVIFLFVIFLGACASNQNGRVEQYLGYEIIRPDIDSFLSGTANTIQIDRREKVVRFNDGMLVVSLPECETEWLCIMPGPFNFAVRKDWNGQSNHWEYAGYVFTVLDSHLTGQKSQNLTYQILSERKISESDVKSRRPVVFLYSVNRGLLAITTMISVDDGLLMPVTYVRELP